MAADTHSIIPGAVLRNLSDKLYEKRKNAVLEIEGIVKQLATAGEHEKISAVIGLLTNDFTYSPQANHRKSSIWNNLHPNQVIGQAAVIKEIDCLTATVDEIQEVRAQVTLPISQDRTRLAALAGWFDVHFRGSMQNPAVQEVELSTAPDENGGTHWGQQVFLLTPPLRVNEGDNVEVSFSMVRSKENHRLMDMEFTYELHESSGKQLPAITTKIYLE